MSWQTLVSRSELGRGERAGLEESDGGIEKKELDYSKDLESYQAQLSPLPTVIISAHIARLNRKHNYTCSAFVLRVTLSFCLSFCLGFTFGPIFADGSDARSD